MQISMQILKCFVPQLPSIKLGTVTLLMVLFSHIPIKINSVTLEKGNKETDTLEPLYQIKLKGSCPAGFSPS